MRIERVVKSNCYGQVSPGLCLRDDVQQLAGLLNISPIEAAGFIAMVGAFTTACGGDDGNLAAFTVGAIEDTCLWYGERGALVSAMLMAGIMIGEADSDALMLSNEHFRIQSEKAINKRISDRKRQQKNREAKNQNTEN